MISSREALGTPHFMANISLTRKSGDPYSFSEFREARAARPNHRTGDDVASSSAVRKDRS